MARRNVGGGPGASAGNGGNGGNGGGNGGNGGGSSSGGGSPGSGRFNGDNGDNGSQAEGTNPNAGILGGIFSGVFGSPTVKTDTVAGPGPEPGSETQTNQSATYGVTNTSDHKYVNSELTYRTIDAQMARAIQESMTAYPEAWVEATGETSAQKQFESVTGINLANMFNQITTTDTSAHIESDPIPGEPGPGLAPGAVTIDGAEVPGVDYFASTLAFFENLFGPKTDGVSDTVDEVDLASEPLVDAGNLVGPGPDVPNGPDLDGAEIIFDPDRCVRIANQLIADPNVESRFKNLAKWHLGSNVPCDTFFNDVSYAANLNQIQGVTQRQIQLEALGLASEDISSALADEAAVREAQRKEDIGYITEVNTRLSDDVVNLGEASLSLQEQIADLGNAIKKDQEGDCSWYNLPCHLENFKGQVGTVAIVGAIGLAAYFLLRRRR